MEPDGDLQLAEILHLTSLREVFGGFTHEIAQPLNALMLAAQVIQFKIEQSLLIADDKSYVLQRLNLMMAQVKRASEIVDSLRSFSRGTWSQTCGRDLVKVLGKVHDLMGQQLLGRGIEFRREAPESILLPSGDPEMIGGAIIQAFAYSRDRVEAFAAWHDDRKIPYKKWVAVMCAGKDGHARVEFSWACGSAPVDEVPAELSARKNLLLAETILAPAGGKMCASDSSIIMTLGE